MSALFNLKVGLSVRVIAETKLEPTQNKWHDFFLIRPRSRKVLGMLKSSFLFLARAAVPHSRRLVSSALNRAGRILSLYTYLHVISASKVLSFPSFFNFDCGFFLAARTPSVFHSSAPSIAFSRMFSSNNDLLLRCRLSNLSAILVLVWFCEWVTQASSRRC